MTLSYAGARSAGSLKTASAFSPTLQGISPEEHDSSSGQPTLRPNLEELHCAYHLSVPISNEIDHLNENLYLVGADDRREAGARPVVFGPASLSWARGNVVRPVSEKDYLLILDHHDIRYLHTLRHLAVW